MTKSEIKVFFRFLKEKNAYNKFWRALLDEGFKNPCQFLLRINAGDAIMMAFYWGGTKEGSTFWNVLDENWQGVYHSGREPWESLLTHILLKKI